MKKIRENCKKLIGVVFQKQNKTKQSTEKRKTDKIVQKINNR